MVEIEEDVAGLGGDLTDLEGFVDFLFDETIIQDERLFTLEQTSIDTTADVESNNRLVTVKFGQQTVILTDDIFFRFAGYNSCSGFPGNNPRRNGGSDGNSLVAKLEVRVETLEGTAADHETRITVTEPDVAGTRSIL